MSRLDGDSAEIQRFAFDTLLAAVASVFRLVGGAAMLFLLDWRLALVPLLAAPLNLAFLSWARPRTRARADELRATRGELAAYMTESPSRCRRCGCWPGSRRGQRALRRFNPGRWRC